MCSRLLVMDLRRLWLVASTSCAGYDNDAQICCEHGGEGGQHVSLSIWLFQLTAGVSMKKLIKKPSVTSVINCYMDFLQFLCLFTL